MHQFPKFTPAWNSTCFGQFLCPSSGVCSLYTRHWYMSYRYEDGFRAGLGWSCSKAVYNPVWHTPVPSVQWTNSWWWAEELPETCRVSCWSKFGKLVHLVAFIIKKFVTMHAHMNVKFTYECVGLDCVICCCRKVFLFMTFDDHKCVEEHISINIFQDVFWCC